MEHSCKHTETYREVCEPRETVRCKHCGSCISQVSNIEIDDLKAKLAAVETVAKELEKETEDLIDKVETGAVEERYHREYLETADRLENFTRLIRRALRTKA